MEKIGNVEKRRDEMELEWILSDFFTIAESGKEFIGPSFWFVNTSWHFRLNPRSTIRPGLVNLFLVKERKLECSVEYYFGFKKLDGSVSVEHLSKGILTEKSGNWTNSLFFKLSEVQEQKSELVPSDTLTVTCMLKRETNHSHQAKMLTPPKLQKFMSKYCMHL